MYGLSCSPPTGPIKNGDIPIEDPTEIANEFNEFFVNVATKLKEPVPNTNHDKLKEFCQSKLPSDMKFKIPQIQKEKVLKFLSTMDVSKATGTDMIGPRLLKLAAPCIANQVTFICNHSINNSVFPNKWKEAKVTPLYKNGSLEEVNNYCPISSLPVMSKVKSMFMTVLLNSCMNSSYCTKPSRDFVHNNLVKPLY